MRLIFLQFCAVLVEIVTRELLWRIGRKVTPPIGEVRNNWAHVAEFYWSERDGQCALLPEFVFFCRLMCPPFFNFLFVRDIIKI